jgi:hypothetical protein
VFVPDGCAFKVASALSGLYPGTGISACSTLMSS